MSIEKKILFISYDGMTDPLGQSQVIPYLSGLREKGFSIDILSAEKKQNFSKRKKHILNLLDKAEIGWHTVVYSKKPPVFSTIYDIYKLKQKALALHKKNKYEIIHCRSYIAAFVGLYLKKRTGVKFLFDMRGFFPDERVDGNIWKLSNPLFNSIYKYFKRKEKEFLSNADYTISLTNAGKDIIHGFDDLNSIPVKVIPCCADLNLFDYNKIKTSELIKYRERASIAESDFVVSYLGSVGTWYMPDEMMQFFLHVKKLKSNAKFLFISHENPQIIFHYAEKNNIEKNDIIIIPAEREEVPYLLSLSTISVFFIKPVFSKKASSPTKMAEILGMGIPIVCNSNVGDIDYFDKLFNFGVTIDNFTETSYAEVAQKIIFDIDKHSKAELRNIAINNFSLSIGVDAYAEVYKKLLTT